ncbi:MAG TPA: helix-turn-helix transcriptional regulator [Candidatus Limnocylindrales bacterium]|nr:helix-turn-helix transcriptional regulator [Candidatus Limnocylindrales bacterium]
MARLARPENFQQWLEMAQKSNYSATLLSKKLKVSPRQLRRFTHVDFGRSPQNWLNEQRLVRAGKMLKRLRSVKAVAFQLGFKQVSHFSREFKLQYGVAPTAFLNWNNSQAGGCVWRTDGRAR